MSINSIASTQSSTATTQPVTQQAQSEIGELDQDAFMTLLLAQLKNQDPLKPMEDKDFIAQLAQFNSLNQLTQMNKTLNELMTSQTLAEGSSLIGKTVSGLASDGSTVTGLVSGLRLVGGKVMLEVGESEMPLDMVNSVQGQQGENDNGGQDQSNVTSGTES